MLFSRRIRFVRYNLNRLHRFFRAVCVGYLVIPVRFSLSCPAVTVAISQLRQVPRTPRSDWLPATLQGCLTACPSLPRSLSPSVPTCLNLSSFDSRHSVVVNHKTMGFLSLARLVARGQLPNDHQTGWAYLRPKQMAEKQHRRRWHWRASRLSCKWERNFLTRWIL